MHRLRHRLQYVLHDLRDQLAEHSLPVREGHLAYTQFPDRQRQRPFQTLWNNSGHSVSPPQKPAGIWFDSFWTAALYAPAFAEASFFRLDNDLHSDCLPVKFQALPLRGFRHIVKFRIGFVHCTTLRCRIFCIAMFSFPAWN